MPSLILQYIQNRSFKQEYNQLKRSDQQSSTKNHSNLSEFSSIYKLDPVLVQGLLQVGSHLNRAPLNANINHPIILPKGCHAVQLIIQYYHHISGHSGLEYTVSFPSEVLDHQHKVDCTQSSGEVLCPEKVTSTHRGAEDGRST